MLKLRSPQIEAMKQGARAEFELNLARHFRKHYPRECRLAGGLDQFVRMVRDGIDRAAEHDCHTQQEVALYIGLMIMLGRDFDADPQLPWAVEGLEDYSVPDVTARLRAIYDQAIDYLGETAGDDSEHVVRAMLRVRAHELEEDSAYAGERHETGLCLLLRRLYPQKYDFQGEELTRGLIRMAVDTGRGYGITGSRGLTVVAVLMFMIGSGIDRDLMHPWVGAALSDPSVTVETARVDRLYAAATAYLNEAFAKA